MRDARQEIYNIMSSSYLTATGVANLVNSPIHISSPDGVLCFVNDAWCTVYGVKREDAIGNLIEDVVDIKSYYLEMDGDILNDPTGMTCEHLDASSDRPVCYYAVQQGKSVTRLTQIANYNKVAVTATPIFDENHNIVYVFTLIQDLSMLAGWRDYIEEETQRNKILQQDLEYMRSIQFQSKMIGNSKELIEIKKLISTVAMSDASILITGENGTGKEVAAKEIYYQSRSQDKPFVTVNCAALPDHLLESELFGHEKGAFTGAISTKIGLFELARDGVILLDEIGEIPMSLQPKLLRVLQEREFRRVGGTTTIPFKARVISATNQDLLTMTQEGKFRMDLYYRINIFPIHIPPLRERREDISLLASDFLNRFNEKYHKNKFFTSQALFALEQYPWPGNVRELENTVERATVIGEQPAITVDLIQNVIHLGTRNPEKDEEYTPVTLKQAVENLERKMISEALATYKTTYKAAEALGSTQPTISRKAQALGITVNKDE